MKKKLVLPKFRNEDAERKYWDTFDITKYYDPGDFVRVRFPNLKPTSTPISIRLPNYMLSELKVRANRLDIPYQALIKQAIAEKMESSK